MQIEYLSWDSNFFSKKIGRIFVEKSDNLENLLKEASAAKYDLIYVFGNRYFLVDNSILDQFNGKLVDKKIIYEKNVEQRRDFFVPISEYLENDLTVELEQLAYEAGKYSRFKLDNNFFKDDFFRMYKLWIDKSIKHVIADNVFIVAENDTVKGLVTLKINNEKGEIGLIAISPNTQRKAYGKSLINKCESELLKKGIFRLEVPTQADNIQACRFYEKCGFQIKDITNIYHFWI